MKIDFSKFINTFLIFVFILLFIIPLRLSYKNNNKKTFDNLKSLNNYAQEIKLRYFENNNIDDWIDEVNSDFSCKEIYFKDNNLILNNCTLKEDEKIYCYNKEATTECSDFSN